MEYGRKKLRVPASKKIPNVVRERTVTRMITKSESSGMRNLSTRMIVREESRRPAKGYTDLANASRTEGRSVASKNVQKRRDVALEIELRLAALSARSSGARRNLAITLHN